MQGIKETSNSGFITATPTFHHSANQCYKSLRLLSDGVGLGRLTDCVKGVTITMQSSGYGCTRHHKSIRVVGLLLNEVGPSSHGPTNVYLVT
jgi:hypothetical protein